MYMAKLFCIVHITAKKNVEMDPLFHLFPLTSNRKLFALSTMVELSWTSWKFKNKIRINGVSGFAGVLFPKHRLRRNASKRFLRKVFFKFRVILIKQSEEQVMGFQRKNWRRRKRNGFRKFMVSRESGFIQIKEELWHLNSKHFSLATAMLFWP